MFCSRRDRRSVTSRIPLTRSDLAGVALNGLRRLGHEHQQAADAGDAAALGLEHESRASGVVDNVDNALERIEPFERAGRVGAMGEHAGGRAVNEQCGVGLLRDVVVVDFARTADRHDDGAQVAEYHAGSGAGATGGTEHEGLLAGNLDAQLLDQTLEAKVVGVVAAQAAVGQARDGVDVSHTLGEWTQLVQVFHDGALVDGHVGALPFVTRHKSLEVLGLALKTHILSPASSL